METEHRDESFSGTSLSPGEETPIGSFRRMLKKRSFALLWLIQLLSQIDFHAARSGVISLVVVIVRSTVLMNQTIICFCLLADVSMDDLNERLALWASNGCESHGEYAAEMLTLRLPDVYDLAGDQVLYASRDASHPCARKQEWGPRAHSST